MNIRLGIVAAIAIVVTGCTSSNETSESASTTNTEVISAATEPAPIEVEIGEMCDGFVGAVCSGEGTTTYCKKPEGECSAEAGVCALIGDGICPEIYDPVCGCDGITYSTACDAESAGVNVISKGECPKPEDDAVDAMSSGADTGEACHGKAGILCANEDDYCKFPVGTCHDPDMQGVCTQKADEICTTQYDPVCGCEGTTYGNSCEADRAGESVLASGTCPQPSN